MSGKLTIEEIKALKNHRKLTMLTAYDYPMARLMDEVGIDIILVGDSLANVVLGLDSTTQVGMKEMLHHARAVTRGVQRALVVADMPFEAVRKEPDRALDDARRFMDEAQCDAVKVEWSDGVLSVARDIVKAGIPVMGHVGLTPQTADKLGGLKVQGRDAQAAHRLIQQAQDFESSGVFSVLIECVPARIAELITAKLKVPTVGIGAGRQCDGQVLVTYDMIGFFDRFTPRFVKKYTDLKGVLSQAFKQYKTDVEEGHFPAEEHTFKIQQDELKKLKDKG